jgi:CBS domain-containing protein
MKLEEIMTRDVEVVHPDDSIQIAAQKMRDRDIGFLPVCDGEHLVGVLSDRDMAIRVIAGGKDPSTTVSRDLVTKPVIYCFSDQEVGDAARLMHDNQVRRLVVLDRTNKQMVGVVSLGDIATNSAEEISGEALQGISKPEGSTKAL